MNTNALIDHCEAAYYYIIMLTANAKSKVFSSFTFTVLPITNLWCADTRDFKSHPGTGVFYGRVVHRASHQITLITDHAECYNNAAYFTNRTGYADGSSDNMSSKCR